jgi:uncharacterized spore protein YtfJ
MTRENMSSAIHRIASEGQTLTRARLDSVGSAGGGDFRARTEDGSRGGGRKGIASTDAAFLLAQSGIRCSSISTEFQSCRVVDVH